MVLVNEVIDDVNGLLNQFIIKDLGHTELLALNNCFHCHDCVSVQSFITKVVEVENSTGQAKVIQCVDVVLVPLCESGEEFETKERHWVCVIKDGVELWKELFDDYIIQCLGKVSLLITTVSVLIYDILGDHICQDFKTKELHVFAL